MLHASSLARETKGKKEMSLLSEAISDVTKVNKTGLPLEQFVENLLVF
jgi:hypothetical protein